MRGNPIYDCRGPFPIIGASGGSEVHDSTHKTSGGAHLAAQQSHPLRV